MGALVSSLQALANVCFSARFRVEGDSMSPLLAHRESVLVVRRRFRWNRLRRGDIVVFERPGGTGDRYIKRVVGLPGEDLRVADGRVYVAGRVLEEGYVAMAESGQDGKGAGAVEGRDWYNGPGDYFLLGDNRADSNDSRAFGPVPEELIQGRAWFRCWPPRRWRPIGPD